MIAAGLQGFLLHCTRGQVGYISRESVIEVTLTLRFQVFFLSYWVLTSLETYWRLIISEYSKAQNIQMILELFWHRVNIQGLSRSFCKPS